MVVVVVVALDVETADAQRSAGVAVAVVDNDYEDDVCYANLHLVPPAKRKSECPHHLLRCHTVVVVVGRRGVGVGAGAAVVDADAASDSDNNAVVLLTQEKINKHHR